MKTVALILLAFLEPAFGPAVSAAAGDTPDLKAVIDSARGAPAEFAADALIRIAAVDQAAVGQTAKSRQIEWLQQAFERASAAQQTYRLRASITRFGGPAAFLNRANAQELDAMSLQLRAIAALLPLDSRRARGLLLQMPPMRLARLTCSEYLVPEVSRFYEVLGSIARSPAFTPKEIQDREPVRLLEGFAGAVTSPAQIAPAAGMIAAAGLDNADFQSLVTGFAGALRKISSDDRSFTYYASAGKQIEVLAEECKRRKVSTIPLLEAYRLYLVTHLSGPRCADDDLMTPAGTSYGVAVEPAAGPAATDALGFFNQRLAAPPLRPIEEQEATPTKLEGLATGLRSCESAGCKAIADRFHSLVFNPVGQAFKPAEKDTPEWHVKLQEFLTAMADWKPGPDESATAHFRERCGLYNDLAAAVPTAADRELTLRALLEFVSRNSVQVNSRIEWFLPVNGLIGRAGLDPVGLARIMDLLRRSSDPVIGLFANLEVLAPRTPDRVLPLL